MPQSGHGALPRACTFEAHSPHSHATMGSSTSGDDIKGGLLAIPRMLCCVFCVFGALLLLVKLLEGVITQVGNA
jgi:hypothetical protein